MTSAQDAQDADPDAKYGELLTFYCPFPWATSPDTALLQEHTLAWAKRFDLGERDSEQTVMLALTGAVFTAHAYPHARRELAQALADYGAWAWMANEHAGSGRPSGELLAEFGRWDRIMRSPNSWPDASNPLDAALRDSMLRLHSCMSGVQWQRFIASQGHWLYSMAWEASLREYGEECGVNDYLATRIGSGGCDAAPGYVDAVEGIELSEKHWARPAVRAATEALMTATVLDNDRYSYLREQRLPVEKHNLFRALRREHPHYTAEQAIIHAVAIRDRCMNLYLALREQLLVDADEDLRRYLTGLQLVFSGNITFGITAARYLLAELAPRITRADKPSTSSIDPLPYPTIAWWWDHLTP
ncbi:hypothetical protein KBY55_02745 [Streptomyces sp. b94]|uniref:terpene synthase family protein n=1 Tax=Streptomyces sp. b94 TaxID=1827634 RepID=UPI001B3798D9|nr:hypothetical protein [Streptomyces sp. b94]MBQ1095044.1 hypothetical protein [Streptomyces sp. b94]